ncbi:MAG TPA: biotin transporter BioY [Actinotalea sp.]|jgi:biotin transport system substrate-specific component
MPLTPENDATALTAPRATRSVSTADIALIGTFAALLAVCSLLSVPVGPAGAPITLQTFAVILAGAVLGARRGALAVLLYLAVGFAGLPIFAQGVGGPATFGKVTLGYLLAFPLAAWLVGLVVERVGRRGWAVRTGVILAAGVLGSLVIYAVGVPVLAARIGVSLAEGIVINNAFLAFDAVKLVLAAVVAASVHRAFPDLLDRR